MMLFHGTASVFKHFSLDFAARDDMNGNGHLGVWLAAARDTASLFGPYCLEVDASFSQSIVIGISDLARMNQECIKAQFARDLTAEEVRAFEREFYCARRQALLDDGYDSIAVRETNGEVAMYIALAPEKLRILNPPAPAIGHSVFHVTAVGTLDAVLAQGLCPQTGPRASACNEKAPAVFCFPSWEACEDALMGWLGEAFDEEEDLAILEIDTRRIPVSVPARSDVAYEIAFLGPIPSCAIVSVFDEQCHPAVTGRRTRPGCR